MRPRDGDDGLVRRLPLVVVAIAALWLALAPPAAAHGEGDADAPATNLRSRVTSVDPVVDGVEWRMVDAGARIEVRNDTDTALVVLGEAGEPFLRVGPDGVHENTRSVTAFRIANPDRGAPVPQEVLEGGDPEWEEVSSARAYAWHDDRAHWAEDEPSRSEEVELVPEWRIDARWGDTPMVVLGDVTWVPPPPVWPSVLVVVLVAALVGALAATGRYGAAVVAGGGLAVTASLLVGLGSWWGSAGSALSKVEGFTLPALAWLLLVAAVVRFRAAPQESVLLSAGACVGLAVLLGVSGWSWLVRSQLPTALPAWLGRACVAGALGVGLGMLVAAALVWFRDDYRATAAIRPGPAAP